MQESSLDKGVGTRESSRLAKWQILLYVRDRQRNRDNKWQVRKPTMAEDKEGELGRSQVIKCLGSRDKKVSPSRWHQEATRRWFGSDVIICVAERDTFINAAALPVKLREGKGQLSL